MFGEILCNNNENDSIQQTATSSKCDVSRCVARHRVRFLLKAVAISRTTSVTKLNYIINLHKVRQ